MSYVAYGPNLYVTLLNFKRYFFNNSIVIMGRENLNLRSANQLSYKALGRSFTNIVAKNSLFVCFGSFVKNFRPYVIYSTELLNLVINFTRYELNRTDK